MLSNRYSQGRLLVQQTPCLNEQLLSSANGGSPDRRRRQPAKSRKRTDNCYIRYPLPYRSTSGIDRYLEQVRKYIEAMKDSSQLLDLLSAAGSGDLGPTKAAAGRMAIYPEVSC